MTNTPLSIIGAHLQAWRLHRGMLQVTLAKRVGMAQNAISAYEVGRRPISVQTALRIAEALEIDLSLLVQTDP